MDFNDEYLWTEKYRPKKIDDCVLTPEMKKTFKAIVKSGEIPNLLLCGTQGSGKTTVAKALCAELGLDSIQINCSEESGIDVLRGKIKQFASSVSLNGSIKVVIMDEADYMNPSSTQPALRGFIEEFSSNCRFIFTCNYKHRIISPIHSRTAVIEFDTQRATLAKLCEQFMKRMGDILDNEKVEYDPAVLAKLIMRHAPDWRRIIGECQRYAATGAITTDILVDGGDASIDELVRLLREKDFKKMRQWVASNMSSGPDEIFRKLYDNAYEYMDPQSIPAAIVIIASYSYKSAFVADHELNLVACLIELMGTVQWKS